MIFTTEVVCSTNKLHLGLPAELLFASQGGLDPQMRLGMDNGLQTPRA